MEALVRWRHPVDGLIPPARFLVVAEESSLIFDIGNFVLETVCRQLRAWHEAGYRRVPVSINLSALQINRGNLIETVADALERHGLPAGLLELELTESTLLHDAERCLSTLATLKAMGITVSIDDFGTGYTSLVYLSRVDVTKLKIDRSIITAMSEYRDDAIVRSIIEIANAMKFKTVAEGVENSAQLEHLCKLGCNSAQGWLISRAQPAHECIHWLEMYAQGRALPTLTQE